MNLNRVELIGGIVRPPELRFLPSGYPMAEFTLAVNDTRYDKEAGGQTAKTDYIACTVWGGMAEQIDREEVKKGKKLYVFGSLDQSEYEDKDGKKVSKTRVRVAWYKQLEPELEGWGEQAEEPETAPF